MSETVPGSGLEDGIEIQQSHDGRWAWVDTDHDGPGTPVVEWIEIIDLARVEVETGGITHLQLNDNEFRGQDTSLSENRWIQSSHWYNLDEIR